MNDVIRRPQDITPIAAAHPWQRWLYTALLLLGSALAAPSSAEPFGSGLETGAEPVFLPVEEAFRVDAYSSEDTVTLIWSIAPEYYFYGHKFKIFDGEQEVTQTATFNRGTLQTDEYFGEVEVHRFQAIAEMETSTAPATREPLELTVQYQGCADAGLCYPVQTRQLQLQNQ